MRRTMLAVSLAASLLLLLAAACSSRSVVMPSPTPVTGIPTTPQSIPTSIAPTQSITITYWEEDSNAAVVLLDALAQEFMAVNPDVVVVREHLGYDDLRNQFRAAALSGKAPALVRSPGEFAGPFGELGIVRPLDEFFSADYLAGFLAGALDGARAKGKLWGVPDNYGGHLMLLHNRAITTEVPANTDGWITQLRILTDATAGQYGLVFPAGESYWLVPWLSAFGGWPLDANDRLALNTAEMVEALWFVNDLIFVDRVMPENVTYEGAFDSFRQGKAAYIIDGAWNLDRYRDLGLDIGVAPLPRLIKTGLTPAPMATGRYWFINSDLSGAALDAAARFVEFMVAPDAQERWLAQMRRFPSHKDVLERHSEPDEADPALSGILAELRVARGVPPALEMGCAWQGIAEYLPDVMTRQLTPDDAPAAMQATGEACIEDMGGYLDATPTPGPQPAGG